jgi:hypothetical protein
LKAIVDFAYTWIQGRARRLNIHRDHPSREPIPGGGGPARGGGLLGRVTGRRDVLDRRRSVSEVACTVSKFHAGTYFLVTYRSTIVHPDRARCPHHCASPLALWSRTSIHTCLYSLVQLLSHASIVLLTHMYFRYTIMVALDGNTSWGGQSFLTKVRLHSCRRS